MRSAANGVTILLAAVLSASCGKDSPTGPGGEAGSFSGALKGSYTASRVGTAEFLDNAEDFRIVMVSGANTRQLLNFELFFYEQPAVGVHEVDATSIFAQLNVDYNTYVADSGTLTITTSTSTLIAGTFDISLWSWDAAPVVFRGTFRAVAKNGTFSATYRGAENGATSGGPASFAVTGTRDFVLDMGRPAGWGDIRIVAKGTGRLGVGTYSVGDGVSTSLSATAVATTVSDSEFSSTSGTVTISASSSTSVRGTFSLELANGSGATLQVWGNFTANCPGPRCS